MTDATSSRIAQLEQEIEACAGAIERSRKAMIAGKIAAVLGALWLSLMVIGAVRFDGLGLVVSLSAIIGGFVMFGSSRATAIQCGETIQRAEAERHALISGMTLHDIRSLDAPMPSRLLH